MHRTYPTTLCAVQACVGKDKSQGVLWQSRSRALLEMPMCPLPHLVAVSGSAGGSSAVEDILTRFRHQTCWERVVYCTGFRLTGFMGMFAHDREPSVEPSPVEALDVLLTPSCCLADVSSTSPRNWSSFVACVWQAQFTQGSEVTEGFWAGLRCCEHGHEV